MEKREHIKTTALEMVAEHGLINLSRAELCERAGVPDGSFPQIMGGTFTEFIQELKLEVTVEATTGPVNRNRVNPAMRKDQLLTVAVTVAAKVGYQNINRQEIAQAAGVSISLVTTYLGTLQNLKRSLMRAAIKEENLAVIAQGLACGDKSARKAPDDLKKRASEFLASY